MANGRLDTQALKLRAYRALRSGAERAGLQVVPKTFYSPIPDLRELPDDIWERRSELRGIRFDLDEQLAWIEQHVAAAMREFSPPAQSTGRAGEYSLDNDSYGRVGADLLHGIVRGLKPRRIVELGSGQSTLIMAAAAERNAAEGVQTRLRTYDPFAGPAVTQLAGVATVERLRAQDVPLDVFAELESGDVLFVDTTHTVKLGSDVNHIVLDVLPALAPGVLVHVHDIFLPFEYPRKWAQESGLYWAEQYLLQAYLSGNAGYEVLVATYALCRERAEAMARLAPTWQPGATASAFWIRRREGGA